MIRLTYILFAPKNVHSRELASFFLYQEQPMLSSIFTHRNVLPPPVQLPPPNFEAQLKCHLLPKAFLDDSNPHKSLPTPI